MLPLLQQHPAIYIVALFVLGACIGSFLNVVILRLPAIIHHQWRLQCRDLLEPGAGGDEGNGPPGLVLPASHCPACGTPLRSWQNIPLLSYLLLRGRCASCAQPISWRYPLIELLTAFLTVHTGLHFGPCPALLAALVLLYSLLVLSVIDIDHRILPDNISLPLLWLGLLVNLGGLFAPVEAAVLGAAGGYVSLWLIYQAHRLITGREGMGYGDFKLLAVSGAWLGWHLLPLVVLFASLAGSIFAIALIASGRQGREAPISFGPFLAVATWIALIWGERIQQNYLHLLQF